MKDKNIDRLILVLAVIFAVLLIAGWRGALADEGHGHHHNDGGGDVEVLTDLAGGDVKTRALSIGQSLGDVDIAGCIVTTQWGIVVFQRQGFVYDVFCLARELDQAGKHDDAAAMRCTHPETAKLYGERCHTVMNYRPATPAPNVGDDYVSAAQFDEQAAVQAVEEEERSDRLVAIEARLDREATARRAYARQLEAEKEARRQKAIEALNAYKEAQQHE